MNDIRIYRFEDADGHASLPLADSTWSARRE